jgi:hypothetical protein
MYFSLYVLDFTMGGNDLIVLSYQAMVKGSACEPNSKTVELIEPEKADDKYRIMMNGKKYDKNRRKMK